MCFLLGDAYPDFFIKRKRLGKAKTVIIVRYNLAKVNCSLTETTGSDALSGEKSLMLDSTENPSWCSMLKVDLDGADGYRVSFKYRVLSVGDAGKICSVIRINKDPESGSQRADGK